MVSSENRRKFEPTPRRRRARSVSITTAARRCSGVFFRRRRVSNASGRSRLTLGVRAFGRALENGESLANTGLFCVRAAEREHCRTPPRAAAAERGIAAIAAGIAADTKTPENPHEYRLFGQIQNKQGRQPARVTASAVCLLLCISMQYIRILCNYHRGPGQETRNVTLPRETVRQRGHRKPSSWLPHGDIYRRE